MNLDGIKQWLELEELETLRNKEECRGDYECTCDHDDFDSFAESLVACRELSEQRRVLMEKHQYAKDDDGDEYCIECGGYKKYSCEPGCLWAKAIEKGE